MTRNCLTAGICTRALPQRTICIILFILGSGIYLEEIGSFREESLKLRLVPQNLEGKTISKRVVSTPTKDLFNVLTSWRSGSEWVFDVLDQHPHVCASGKSLNPKPGFPTESLNINDSPQIPVSSTAKGCLFQFVLTQIQELTQEGTPPPRCTMALRHGAAVVSSSDSLPHEHLSRLCKFIDKLEGNYTQPFVVKAWVDAFVAENQDLMGCSCPVGSEIKGLKLMNDWILDFATQPPKRLLNLHETAIGDSKVIRFRRANLFARYQSLLTAQETNVWHARTNAESLLGVNISITVNIEHMIKLLKFMDRSDRFADLWARKFASDVLWVTYEDCKESPLECFNRMFEFLGVERQEKLKGTLVPFKKGNSSSQLLDTIENKGDVRMALKENGWGHFIGEVDDTTRRST